MGNGLTDAAMERLYEHTWPGNVRELANVIEHATILCDGLPIDVEHLPRLQRPNSTGLLSKPMTLREIEQLAIQRALDRHEGSKPKAAEELGVSLKTLYNKLNQAESIGKSA